VGEHALEDFGVAVQGDAFVFIGEVEVVVVQAEGQAGDDVRGEQSGVGFPLFFV
jgi:hypothetical protein